MQKSNNAKLKKCSDCIHEAACGAWNIGSLCDADATSCANYETIKESTAYFLGMRDGQRKSLT